MAGMIDHDLRDFAQAVNNLRTDPTNELLRQKVHETSRFVWLSAMEAAELYKGVIEDVGWVEGKTRAQLIKEGFEEALALMSPVCDDYLRAVKSRWDGLQRFIVHVIRNTT